MTKITKEIKEFIKSNSTKSDDALVLLIKEHFNVDVTDRTIDPYLKRSRIEVQEINNAVAETVRGEIFATGKLRAEKYLRYLDENVEALHAHVVEAKDIEVKDMKDFVAVCNSLQKNLCSVLDYVKPPDESNVNINIRPDLSKLSPDDLRALRSIRSKFEGDRSGTSPPKVP